MSATEPLVVEDGEIKEQGNEHIHEPNIDPMTQMMTMMTTMVKTVQNLVQKTEEGKKETKEKSKKEAKEKPEKRQRTQKEKTPEAGLKKKKNDGDDDDEKQSKEPKKTKITIRQMEQQLRDEMKKMREEMIEKLEEHQAMVMSMLDGKKLQAQVQTQKKKITLQPSPKIGFGSSSSSSSSPKFKVPSSSPSSIIPKKAESSSSLIDNSVSDEEPSQKPEHRDPPYFFPIVNNFETGKPLSPKQTWGDVEKGIPFLVIHSEEYKGGERVPFSSREQRTQELLQKRKQQTDEDAFTDRSDFMVEFEFTREIQVFISEHIMTEPADLDGIAAGKYDIIEY